MPDSADLEQKAKWILRVLSLDMSRERGPALVADAGPLGHATVAPDGDEIPGLAAWQTARAAAVQSIDQLEAAFRTMDEPEVPQAIILLAAIRAQLTPKPDTQQKVEALRRYIEQDTKIEEAEMPNGFGFTVSLRAPLLAALSNLRPPE